MATAPKNIPQDMPPKGGYGPINIDRIPLRSIFRAPAFAALFTLTTVGGFYIYKQTCKRVHRNDFEQLGARFAVLPILLAERDRSVLKNLKRMRDEERELMKNVEGWEVGTYYGEPIYMTEDPNEFRALDFHEYFNLAPEEYTHKRMFLRMWS